MLTTIGRKPKTAGDLVAHLLECHERIRTFVRIAESAGRRDDLDRESVIEACSRSERYFIRAFPLHIEDEEKSILPRLLEPAAAPSLELREALHTMEQQHGEHEPRVRVLLETLSAVRAEPERTELRAALARVAAELATAFEEHLVLEERVVFPAVRRLPSETQARIQEEMRGRRR
ncbi:MAG TPA: hemerythrin domain-containing protein [Polyangiaceae bacterium]|nr:hemerythrin domain-containing protein [Polyangiaceae bacterium]